MIDLTQIFDSPKGELLASHWCRNPTIFVFAIQNCGFVSWLEGGMPPLPCDGKLRFSVMEILHQPWCEIPSWARGDMHPPVPDTKPQFCVAGEGGTLALPAKTRQDLTLTQSGTIHVPKSNYFFMASCEQLSPGGAMRCD